MSELKALLASLPQAAQIQQEHAERWLENILRFHKPRAEWHAKRLAGIGGSEIGAVIRGLLGIKESGFGSLPRVVEQKLMMRVPEYETVHMKRGTALEDLARQAFLIRYKATQDAAALDATVNGKCREGFEWLVGNPDDLVTIGNRRFLVDYKVPSQFDDEVSFDYSAQLHHYALKAQMAGVRIDGMILAKLDLPSEMALHLTKTIGTLSASQVRDIATSVAKTDMPGLRIAGLVVERDRQMSVNILDCGRECWSEFVLKGIVPPKPESQLVELTDEKMLKVANLQQQYVMAKAGASYLSDVAKQVEEALSAELEGVAFEGKAMPLSIVKVSPKGIDKQAVIEEAKALGATEAEIGGTRSYSLTALVEEIKRLNGDATADHLFEAPAPDFEKASAYLAERGLDAASFAKPGISMRLSTTKKDKKLAGAFEREAADRFSGWLDDAAVSAREQDDLEVFEGFDLEANTGSPLEVFGEQQACEIETMAPRSIGASMR